MSRLSIYLSMITLLLAVGCRQSNGDRSSIRLARVGTNSLTLDEALDAIPSFVIKQDSIKALQQYRNNWIEEQILLDEARKLDLEQQQTVKKQLAKAREEVLVNALKKAITAQVTKTMTITDRDIINYYQKHKSQLKLDERFVQFRHLETEKLSEALAAREALQKGTYWPDVARQYSLNAEAKIKHAQKYWPVSTVLNDLSTMKPYIATLDSGAVSPIQREHGTYHFIQLVDSREKGDYTDPRWIEGQLRSWLVMERQRKHYNSYLKNLYLNKKEDNELDVFNVLPTDTLTSN